jgi:tRNA1Val (adenine37-N6)-methyltransferase
MANSYFQFKHFTIHQDRCAMKVTTDGCLFGAWVTGRVRSSESGVGSVLDIGTGTGLLSLMIAQKCNADITAIEVDEDAFDQASENFSASKWKDRLKIIHSDTREYEFDRQYDFIVSNPPFYENELKGGSIKKNIAHHNEGLLLPELLAIIKRYLKPGGTFFLLLPFKRNEEIRKLFTENDLTIGQLVFVKQSTKHNFFRIILEGKIKTESTTEIKIDEISIKDEQDQYTPAFINLLKEYYLHL